MVIQKVEQDGIVFIDEIDKIAKPEVTSLIINILLKFINNRKLWYMIEVQVQKVSKEIFFL